ncbi:MAG: hypothetical protein ACRBBJ_12620 [Rhodomicrobiaceae bacterium]
MCSAVSLEVRNNRAGTPPPVDVIVTRSYYSTGSQYVGKGRKG